MKTTRNLQSPPSARVVTTLAAIFCVSCSIGAIGSSDSASPSTSPAERVDAAGHTWSQPEGSAAPSRDAEGPALIDASAQSESERGSHPAGDEVRDELPETDRRDSSVASGCAERTRALCDDFESGHVDTTLWSVKTIGGATLEVDTAHTAHGTHALHVRTLRDAGHGAWLEERTRFPVPKDKLFARAWFYVPRAPTNIAQFALGLTGTTPYGGAYWFGAQLEKFLLTYAVTSPFFEHWKRAAEAVPVARWFCAEWQLEGSHPVESHVWIDGAELTDAVAGRDGDTKHFSYAAADKFDAPVFDVFAVGWRVGHVDSDSSPAPAPTVDVWLDDVALDGERIGCD